MLTILKSILIGSLLMCASLSAFAGCTTCRGNMHCCGTDCESCQITNGCTCSDTKGGCAWQPNNTETCD